MANFDPHSRCARCRDKGLGQDPCVLKLQCELCDNLTPEQLLQLLTPTYKLRKEKSKSKEALVDPSTVTIVSQVESQEVASTSPPHVAEQDLSLPPPMFRQELKELDEKWSVRMARLEALITLGQRPSPQPSFSPVKAPVSHQAPAGALSQAPFLLSSVPSGQAGPASGPDRIKPSATVTTSSIAMTSPLEGLYTEQDPEPVFSQQSSSGPVASAFPQPPPQSNLFRSAPEHFEEGEVSDQEDVTDQPDQESPDLDKTLSKDQNYRETVRGVRAFMGWSHIPDLEYTPSSRSDNPWIGHRAQPVGKVSIDLPPEDWLSHRRVPFQVCGAGWTSC